MNTFRANLLPCAGTAGGASAQPSAAGRLSIVVRADRPGAILNSNPVERGFSRAIYPDAFFGGRRLAASGVADRAGKLQVQPPLNFLGLGRAIQPSEQTARGLTNRFQVNHSLRDAPASEMQETTEGIPDERKPTARDGNLTARERKNAC